MIDIQVYADKANIEAERDTMNVVLQGVDLGLLLGQINTKEVLDALKANDQYQEIVDYVSDEESDGGTYELPGFGESMEKLGRLGR